MTEQFDGWPIAETDPVRRLYALSAGIGGAAVTERLIGAPLADVWAVLTDFENRFGSIQPDMKRVTQLSRAADRVELHARSRFGMRARLRGVERIGWCWLQSRYLVIGMAARPQGALTLVALTGGIRIPGRLALLPIGVRREARRGLDRLEQLLAEPE